MKVFGIIIVDKPVGPTSHKIVTIVRRGTGERKVGHAGTLDPRASGVLVLCLGPATRLSEYLSTSTKRYEGTVRFGAATQTYDAEGPVVLQTENIPTLKEIQDKLSVFRGEIEQVPPPYSAIKVRGKKAYELARAGRETHLEPRVVTIHRLDIIKYRPPDLELDIECSAGTYIRSIAHDLGDLLSSGAHLASLRRTRAGPFTLEDAVPMPKLEVGFLTNKWERYLLPASSALPDMPIVSIEEEILERIRFGHRIPAEPGSSGMAKAIGPNGELVAILEAIEGDEEWQPRKVFQG